MAPVIFWFRNDLRLGDNRALAAAAASGAPVIPVYILDDETPGRWRMGAASRWWLDKSLEALAGDLARRNSKLVLRQGEASSELARLVSETGASAIYCSRAYEPWAARLEADLKRSFGLKDVMFKRYAGALLREPESVVTKTGEPFKVYSPFWRAFAADFRPAPAIAAPDTLQAPKRFPKSDALDSWGPHPKGPDWSCGLARAWTPGEAGAHARLATFLADGLKDYANRRNRPDVAGTSRLSPHLHFGEISPAACWRAGEYAAVRQGGADKGLETFLKEMAWREFSYSLLAQFPQLPEQPLRAEFARFPWRNNPRDLKAWQRGRTGYPIVDAGMRELWETGYMHNRVRMIVASFLIKDLMIPWQRGAAWFWDTLVDADLANNAASWQWVAGSGADAAPYFRIFNPVLQGAKFDPEGVYVRRWVAELRGLSSVHIHAPWQAPSDELERARVALGKSYPLPIVDHGQARSRALAAYGPIRHGTEK